ncbi:MAG: single-stranded DNA-binding protein [Crocinitomicaceae bacterium]|jgi:single-strand DNA-binding protein|nr:single-stranded DNA-binding protein [Crocinitomicaceae bacterium]
MNQITLVGNMGDFAKVTQFENGAKVARFNLATHSKSDETKWYRMFAWGNIAQFIERFGSKGRKIVVTGKIVERTYITKEGTTRKVEEVEVRHVVGL